MSSSIVIILVGGIVSLFCLGGLVGNYLARNVFEKEAVARGHARYNSETKEFEWKIFPGIENDQD